MAVHRATHASNATVSSSDITIIQGELFSFPGDDKPTRGYRGTVASKVASITYRQLDYWARKQIVEPSIKASHGSGSRRLYSFKDVLILAVSKRLLDAGVNLQNVTIAIGYLMQRSTAQLEHTTILSDGEHVHECRDGDRIGDVLGSGAAVFGISVTALWHGIEQRLEQEPHVDVFPDGSVTASQMPSGGPFEELAQARIRRKLEIRHEERSMQDLDEYDPFLVHV